MPAGGKILNVFARNALFRPPKHIYLRRDLRYNSPLPVASTATLPIISGQADDAVNHNRWRLIVLVAGLAALWVVLCRHLSAEWSYNEQYNYGWFVPFFALYLFWLRWEDRPEPSPLRSRSVLVPLALVGLVLLFPIRLAEVANPDWRLLSWIHGFIAVGLTLLLIWSLGGSSWLRHFAFPVLFVLISVPWLTGIEQPIIQGLMPTVAGIATNTLSLFGIPAEVQGNLIRISNGVVGVSEACSGVRSFQTSIMIGLLFGELKRMSAARRIALVIAAVAIAFIANCGRAFFLVWIAATRGVGQVEHWHDIAGYAIVGLVFLGCLGLTRLFSRPAATPAAPGVPARSKAALPSLGFLASVLALLVLIEAGVEGWYRAHERDLQRTAQWNVSWPESAPQFRDLKIDERTKALLHYDEGRGAVWISPEPDQPGAMRLASESSASLLYFFRWRPGHNSALLANAHRPDVCLPASGWRQTADDGVRSYEATPGLTIPFRHFEFTNDTHGQSRQAHAFYCVWEDRVRKDESNEAHVASAPSAWTRSERIQAVKEGRRHLGQQVMEYLLLDSQPITKEEAEERFANTVRELVAPSQKTVATTSDH